MGDQRENSKDESEAVVEAQKALPNTQQNKGNKVQQALSYIGKLYQLECAIKDKLPDEKQAQRQTKAHVVLDQFKTWLDK